MITVPKLEVKLVDCLMYCADFLEIDRAACDQSAESFVYYVMSQKREVWSNQVEMSFELSENGLHYYELRVQRGLRQMQVVADQRTGGVIPLKCAGQRRGHPDGRPDSSSCAERLLQKRLFSAIILTGRICTDGLGDRFYAADLQTAPWCLRRWMYLPEGR